MTVHRTRFTILLATLAIVALLVGGGYFVYWEHFSEAHALAKRMDARRRWLEIAAAGRAQNGSMDDARVLAECFKMGDSISDIAAILATAVKRNDLTVEGIIEYQWVFVVPKPKQPDATNYIITIYVDTKKQPPIIESILGSYTMD